MLIESKIRRKNGSNIDMRGTKYLFAPNAEGAHVAEVKDEEHIALFLAVPEGYKIYRPGDVAKEQKNAVAQVAETAGTVETNHDPVVETLDQLKDKYKAKFGKAPHHKWSADKIREELAA